jgi:hypothetical protein
VNPENVGDMLSNEYDLYRFNQAANCSARNSQLSTPTAPGVYVLRLINGDDVKTQKIVVE